MITLVTLDISRFGSIIPRDNPNNPPTNQPNNPNNPKSDIKTQDVVSPGSSGNPSSPFAQQPSREEEQKV